MTYRSRRTKAEIEEVKEYLWAIAYEDQPVTVRQVFYRAVSAGVIEKTENEYKSTVVRLLKEMRLSGDLPWHWIADNTRWMRRPRTFDSVEDALRHTARTYRRALWSSLPIHVEIWLEKEALAGVLVEVTDEWDVPLMVTRGYPSLTFLESSARALPEDRLSVIYYFGDLDPSGVDISRNVEERLWEFSGVDVNLHFERVAVEPYQVRAWNLPTRPTKKTDTRAKDWEGGSVEVDAIPPSRLRAITKALIENHVPEGHFASLKAAEDSERRTISDMVNGVTYS